MHFVKGVQYITDFRLRLLFEDGIEKEIDLLPYLDGEVFEPLKNVEMFRQVHVNEEIDTIVWENGADFSPDFLYEIGSLVKPGLKTAQVV
ncbi:MAG: DUF2442 domain-containing protein [Bacteroidota bacterium]